MFYVHATTEAIVMNISNVQSEESISNIYSIFTILEALQVISLWLTYLYPRIKSEEGSKGESYQRWNNGKDIIHCGRNNRVRKKTHMLAFFQAQGVYSSQG